MPRAKKEDSKLVMIETRVETGAFPAVLSPTSREPPSPRKSPRGKKQTVIEAEVDETTTLIETKTTTKIVEKEEEQEEKPTLKRVFQFVFSLIGVLLSDVDYCDGYWCTFLIVSHWLTVTLTGMALLLSLVELSNSKVYKSTESFLEKAMTLVWFVTNVGELIYPGPNGLFHAGNNKMVIAAVLGWIIGFATFVNVWAGVLGGYFASIKQSAEYEGLGVVRTFISPFGVKWQENSRNFVRLLQGLWLPLVFLYSSLDRIEFEHVLIAAAAVSSLLLLNTVIHPRIGKTWRLWAELILDVGVLGALITATVVSVSKLEEARFLIAEIVTIALWALATSGTVYSLLTA